VSLETDAALALARGAKVRDTGVSTEIGEVLALASTKIGAVGIATDVSEVFALAATKIGVVGIAIELDEAFSLFVPPFAGETLGGGAVTTQLAVPVPPVIAAEAP
jgi:hypothetical protein